MSTPSKSYCISSILEISIFHQQEWAYLIVNIFIASTPQLPPQSELTASAPMSCSPSILSIFTGLVPSFAFEGWPMPWISAANNLSASCFTLFLLAEYNDSSSSSSKPPKNRFPPREAPERLAEAFPEEFRGGILRGRPSFLHFWNCCLSRDNC